MWAARVVHSGGPCSANTTNSLILQGCQKSANTRSSRGKYIFAMRAPMLFCPSPRLTQPVCGNMILAWLCWTICHQRPCTVRCPAYAPGRRCRELIRSFLSGSTHCFAHTHTSVLIFQSYAFNRPFVLQCQVLLGMHATDYDAIQTCNCLKDERKRLAVRRYAGVFVVVLPCGHIVVVRHLVGAEGLPQVAVAFADALNATQGKKFLCYDNACALARFCRNPIRAAHMECFQHCRFVLPESHARGHTACLDPTHTHYLPEVRKAAHPELTGVNTEAQEHVFSWVRWLTHVANPMTPVRHRSFFLLLCLARNRYRLVGLRMRATPRKRRTWRIWPGVRQGARSAAVVEPNPQVQEANNMEAQPALPDQVANLGAAIPPPPPPPEPLPGYLLNLRDGKLHRLASLHRLACGASLPRQSRCLHSRDEVQRSKLCLRNGCFSPGAQP